MRVHGCIADGCALQKKGETEFNAVSCSRLIECARVHDYVIPRGYASLDLARESLNCENRAPSAAPCASQFAILSADREKRCKQISRARERIAKLASSRLGFRFAFLSLPFFPLLFSLVAGRVDSKSLASCILATGLSAKLRSLDVQLALDSHRRNRDGQTKSIRS
jgi:hypothetical protein